MPNIEVHGLTINDAIRIRKEIYAIFNQKPYLEEITVEFHPTQARDHKLVSRPYLRIVTSRGDDQRIVQEILETLESLNMDIEHIEIKRFIPKEK